MNVLPKGWSEVPLGELGEWRGGGTPSKSRAEFWQNGSIPWVSPKDMKNYRVDRAEDLITQHALEVSTTSLLPAGSVLMVTRSGILRHTLPVGVTSVDVTINQDLKALIPAGGADSNFLAKQVVSKSQDILATCAKAGTTVDSIDFDRLKEFPVALPPLAEQKRIVAKVESLTAKSARARVELQKINRLVARYKDLVLVKALRGELTIDWRQEHLEAVWSQAAKNKITKQIDEFLSNRRGARVGAHATNMAVLGELPRTWLMGFLASTGSLQVGYAFKSAWYSYEGERLLRGANVAPGQIDWSDEKRLAPEHVEAFSAYKLIDGDIVIAMDRPLISTGLKIAVVGPEDAGCLLVQRVGRFQSNEMFDQKYVWWVLNSKLFLEHCIERSTGSDLPHISGNDIQSTPTPLPPIEEQHEIVRRIETAFAKIDRLAAEAKRALELTDRLDEKILAKAFRGELVPQDPNDEPASVLLERIRAERAAAPKAKQARRGRSRAHG